MVCWDVDQCCNSVLGCICVFLCAVGGCTIVVMVCWDVDQHCNGMLGCVYMCFCGVVDQCCNGVLWGGCTGLLTSTKMGC